MPGIKVEVKKGQRWWYVVVDFGDGNPPVSKGPMTKTEAEEMAAELEGNAKGEDGVALLDRSQEEEIANQRMAFAFFTMLGCTLLLIALVVAAAVSQ